jgi:hypothetical protein
LPSSLPTRAIVALFMRWHACDWMPKE